MKITSDKRDESRTSSANIGYILDEKERKGVDQKMINLSLLGTNLNVKKILGEISKIQNDIDRREAIYLIIKMDGIVINDYIYSIKYKSPLICGHWYYEMLIDNAPGPRSSMFYYKGKNLQAIRSGPWKAHYITTDELGKDPVEQDPPLLFNLDKDPGEHYNVADENPEILELIRKLMLEHERTFEQ